MHEMTLTCANIFDHHHVEMFFVMTPTAVRINWKYPGLELTYAVKDKENPAGFVFMCLFPE